MRSMGGCWTCRWRTCRRPAGCGEPARRRPGQGRQAPKARAGDRRPPRAPRGRADRRRRRHAQGVGGRDRRRQARRAACSRSLHDMGDRVKPGELLVELEPDDADLASSRPSGSSRPSWPSSGSRSLPPRGLRRHHGPGGGPGRGGPRPGPAEPRPRAARSMQRRAGTTQDLQNAENDERRPRPRWPTRSSPHARPWPTRRP